MARSIAQVFAAIAAARRLYEGRLFQDPNIVGLGSGYRRRDGELTDEPALVAYVATKVPVRRLSADRLLPRALTFYHPLEAVNLTVATDVVEVGRIFAYAHTGRYRPAPGGVSIGHPTATAGTLGGYVLDQRTGEVLLLSNNHVIAGQNACQAGDPILQQGPLDGGLEPDVLARLERWVPLDFAPNGSNLVDAAVARPVMLSAVELAILGLGAGPNAATAAQVGMAVQKSGRSTERTTGGRVASIDATFRVDYSYTGSRVAWFRDALIVLGPEGFSQPGDSGSLLLTEEADPKVMGLLFAGNASGAFSLGNHIQHVFNLLEVGLVSPLDEALRDTPWQGRCEDLSRLAEALRGSEAAAKVLALLQRHSAELWRILREHPDLREQAARALVPLLETLHAAGGLEGAKLERLEALQIRGLLDRLQSLASIPLGKGLAWLRGALARCEGQPLTELLKETEQPVALPPQAAPPERNQGPKAAAPAAHWPGALARLLQGGRVSAAAAAAGPGKAQRSG